MKYLSIVVVIFFCMGIRPEVSFADIARGRPPEGYEPIRWNIVLTNINEFPNMVFLEEGYRQGKRIFYKCNSVSSESGKFRNFYLFYRDSMKSVGTPHDFDRSINKFTSWEVSDVHWKRFKQVEMDISFPFDVSETNNGDVKEGSPAIRDEVRLDKKDGKYVLSLVKRYSYMPEKGNAEPGDEGHDSSSDNLWLWLSLGALAAIVILIVIIKRKKKS